MVNLIIIMLIILFILPVVLMIFSILKLKNMEIEKKKPFKKKIGSLQLLLFLINFVILCMAAFGNMGSGENIIEKIFISMAKSDIYFLILLIIPIIALFMGASGKRIKKEKKTEKEITKEQK